MDLTRLARHERSAIFAGTAIRVALLVAAVPVTFTEWFLPFLSWVATARELDPWTSFLAAGGRSEAFPYGPLYLVGFLPLAAIGELVSPRAAALGLGLSVLVFDIALWRVLARLAGPGRSWISTFAYWLSPIVIYVCYWHGQLDVLPVLILAISLVLIREHRFGLAGAALGFAAAAKLSMALASPFVWIYVTASRRMRSVAARLILATLLSSATMLPFVASPGFRKMVLETPEKDKIFALAISYGDLNFYVVPLVFIGLAFAAWRIRQFDFTVLSSLIGVVFFSVFLLTPASPGWALWLLPFIVLHLLHTGMTAWLLTIVFSTLFVVFHLATSSGAILDTGAMPGIAASARVKNVLLSIYLAAAGGLAYQILVRGVLKNSFYRSSRTPLTFGISGDSGAGKDTLADALVDIFGQPTSAVLSGDDYHRWDRHKPMWHALTHLNPRANDLRRFTEDALALKRGQSVQVAHYDHTVGRMTKPRTVSSAPVIIVLGLHALHPPELLTAFDLRVFLDMDEDLRRFYKIRRDVRIRGHSAAGVLDAIERREADSERFIRPQNQAADLVLSLIPADSRQLRLPPTTQTSPTLGLAIRIRPTADLGSLTRVLIGLCGLEVLSAPINADGRSGIIVVGNPSALDIQSAAQALVPALFDQLALKPRWAAGLTGVMQLAVLDQLLQSRTTRGHA